MKKIMLYVFSFMYFTINFILFFSINANAYIDPSVMTYVIQAVTGVAIAIGAFVGIYWRRARKKINKKLNIDENRNKEVESDEIIIEKTEIKQH